MTFPVRKPLNKLADIRLGHTFRGRIVEDPSGPVRVIQIRDIKGQPTLNAGQLPKVRWPLKEKIAALTSAGDILLPARGEYYQASMLEGSDPVVASSQLFVLRTSSEAVLPGYLGWYLNQDAAQHYFLTHRSGTSMPMLNKQSLGALPVVIPPLATQEKIVSVQHCWEQEKRVTEQLLINREKMLKGIFQRLLEA